MRRGFDFGFAFEVGLEVDHVEAGGSPAKKKGWFRK